MGQFYLLLLAAAVASGPLLYILLGLTVRRSASYEDYHYAGRTLSLHHFVDTTVAYALQVAVLTLFATWGYEFGFWTIWVAIFWALGYVILSYMLDRGWLDRFLLQDNVGTIHQFLSTHGNSRALGALAALASLIGITGPAMYEAHFTGQVVTRLIASLGPAENVDRLVTEYAPTLALSFITIGAIYMLYGGFRSVINTDVWQLGLGYVSVSAVVAILLYQTTATAATPAITLLAFLLLLSVVLAVACFRCLPGSKRRAGWNSVALPLLAGLLAYAISLLLSIAKVGFSAFSGQDLIQFSTIQKVDAPLSLGIMSLVSLFIANALYQIVDIGQWQRLAAVQFDRTQLEASKRAMSSAIRLVGIYSAATWIVAIVFGMALRYSVADIASNPYDALALFLVKYQASGNAIDHIVVLLFVVGIIAVMFSTLDSLVACIAFTVHNDWVAQVRRSWRTIRVGRLTTAIYLFFGFAFYVWLSTIVSNFSDILYSCWAAQIALFPLVVVSLAGRPMSGAAGILSLLAGMIASLWPIYRGAPWSPYQHAPILSLVFSSLVLWIAMKALPKRGLGGS